MHMEAKVRACELELSVSSVSVRGVGVRHAAFRMEKHRLWGVADAK